MLTPHARSKPVVLVAAVAENRVIGRGDSIPWHVPEDFRHFKQTTLGHTLLMGRATFDSIGHPLPDRTTLVLTRDRAWSHPGVRAVHDMDSALDLAESLPGKNVMVVGGSHIYAAALPLAQMQILSTIHQSPEGDIYYPPWDEREWVLDDDEKHEGFTIRWFSKLPAYERTFRIRLDDAAADAWWSRDWAARLQSAVDAQRKRTSDADAIDWGAVHQAAMRVIVEAAEDRIRRGQESHPSGARQVRLSSHLSLQDLHAVQGSLFHWSDFLAPRGGVIRRSGP